MQKKKNTMLIILLCIILIIFALSYFLKPKSIQNSQDNTENSYVFLKGVTLSPISYQSDDFNNFLNILPTVANTISYQGSIDNLKNENNPAFVTESLAKSKNLHSIVIVSFFNQSTGKLNKELSTKVQSEYYDLLYNFVEQNNPKYLGIGIEVNLLKDKNTKEFKSVVSFIDSTMFQLNKKFPETTYFTVFQLEQLLGLKGGLFGGKNDTNNNDFALIDEFKNSEIIGLTSYPGLIYKKPSDIPVDYYKRINEYSNKKTLYTEIGWSSVDLSKEWKSSEQLQSQFISKFFSSIDKENTVGTIWSFLYDQDTKAPFNSMGLITRTNKLKKGYNTWINIENNYDKNNR